MTDITGPTLQREEQLTIRLFPGAALVLVTGASGSGKTTLCRTLLERHADRVHKVITCTTRKSRPNERYGVDYFFLTSDEFRQEVAAGRMIESALVYGHHYGTPRSQVIDPILDGKIAILSLDIQGWQTFLGMDVTFMNTIKMCSIFMQSANQEDMTQRIRKRADGMSEQDIAIRMAKAVEENKLASKANFRITSVTGNAYLDYTEAVRNINNHLASFQPWMSKT